MIEKGDANVTLDKLNAIAGILGVSVETLVRRRKPKVSEPKDEPKSA